MRHFFVPLMSLLAFTLVGCPTAQTASGAAPVPALVEVYSESFPYNIKAIEYSGDGSTLVVASDYNFAGLYNAIDYTLLDKHAEHSAIFGAGFINANTWYFAESFIDSNNIRAGSGPTKVHFRTIHPAQEVSVFTSPNHGNGNYPFAANENYFANDGRLINWHSGRQYEYYPAGIAPRELLTRSNRVMTTQDGYVVLNDPVNDISDQFDTDSWLADITPDERYIISVTGRGACKLWQLPEKTIVHRCERDTYFLASYAKLNIAPGGAAFAFSRDQFIKIYHIEPFRLERKLEMPGIVAALALSDDGWLAAIDEEGHLRVWDVATGNLVGGAQFEPQPDYINIPVKRLTFQPGGRHLAVLTQQPLKEQTLKVLELPERQLSR
jgi:WD40 repeat protein